MVPGASRSWRGGVTSFIGVVLLVTAAGTSLSACGGSADAEDPAITATSRDRPVVVVVGDSITFGAEAALHAALDDETDLHVEGVSGATTAQMLPASTDMSRLDPDLVVINLGTNDATTPASSAATEEDLRDHLAEFPSASCRFLVTITEQPTIPGYAATAADTNARIRRLDDELDATDVIDWQAALADDDAAGSPDGPFLSDDVHPTPGGQAVLVDMIADALGAGCDAP